MIRPLGEGEWQDNRGVVWGPPLYTVLRKARQLGQTKTIAKAVRDRLCPPEPKPPRKALARLLAAVERGRSWARWRGEAGGYSRIPEYTFSQTWAPQVSEVTRWPGLD